jgi:hypothetical protein
VYNKYTNFKPDITIKTRYYTYDLSIIKIFRDFFIKGNKKASKILEKLVCPAL